MSVVPAAAADRTRQPIPLRIDSHGGIQISVTVNDAGPFTFVLDTGAARSVVSDELARELGAPVVAQSEIVTSAGSEMGMVVRLGSVEIEGTRVESLLAPVVAASRLAALGRGVRGLLGQDFLSGFNYTLDYRRTRLTWDGTAACGSPAAVVLTTSEGRFIAALVDGGGKSLRLVPDSGAEVMVLFAGNPPGTGRVRVEGVAGGIRSASMTTVAQLRVGSATLRDQPAVIAERDDTSADGLLPLHRFSAVTFGAGGSCLIVRQ
jgi:predicted aspartyl protease